MKAGALPVLLRRVWFAAGVLMALVIATLMLLPAREVPDPLISDKAIHLIAFAVLGFWFGSLVRRHQRLRLLVILVAFGGLIEIAQGLMQLGRQAEWYDLLADAAGVVLGLGLSFTALGRWPAWMDALAGRAAS